MQKFTIIQTATLHTGTLELSAAQHKGREHALKRVGKDRYEIISPVQFKVGEVISYEGDLPKALANVMIDEAAAKKEATKKEKAQRAKAEVAAAEKAHLLETLESEIKALGDELSQADGMEASLEIEARLDAKVAEFEAAKG